MFINLFTFYFDYFMQENNMELIIALGCIQHNTKIFLAGAWLPSATEKNVTLLLRVQNRVLRGHKMPHLRLSVCKFGRTATKLLYTNICNFKQYNIYLQVHMCISVCGCSLVVWRNLWIKHDELVKTLWYISYEGSAIS